MENFPTPPDGKVYQLWLIGNGSVKGVGTMNAGERSGTMYVPAIGQADKVGVTLEPVGGSVTPSMDPITGVNLV
jgi:hypothetical protein